MELGVLQYASVQVFLQAFKTCFSQLFLGLNPTLANGWNNWLCNVDPVFGGDGKFACTCSFWGACLKKPRFLFCSGTITKPGAKTFQWYWKRSHLSPHQSTNLRFPLLKVASSYNTSKIETLSARHARRLGVCADTSIQRTVIRGKFLLLNLGLN